MSETNGQPSGQIFQLIPKVMADIGDIGKTRKNQQQGYSFRGIDDVYNAVHGALVTHGVFIVPSVIDRAREERPTRDGKGVLIYTTLTVRHTFYAPDGSSVEAVTVGEAMDSGDKSSNKAMSAAMKYAVIETFAIPTEGDNDTENESPQPAPRQAPQPAPPPSNDPAFDAYVAELAAAYEARGFTKVQAKAANDRVLVDKKVHNLATMPGEMRTAYLTKLKAGELDHLKEPKKPRTQKAA